MLEYESLYMSWNVFPNMVMFALQDLIKMTLYKKLNVTIHHQWENLFILHINSKFPTHICENSSSNSFDFDSEKKHCTSTYTLMHYFLDIPK